MSDTYETIYNADRTERVRIEPDYDYPLDHVTEGTGFQIYVSERNRYMSSIGDNFRRQFDELGPTLFARYMRIFWDTEVVPVYMLVHSVTRLSTTSFGDPWDSGLAGVAFTPPEHQWQGMDQEAVAKGMVDTLDEVINGEVYGLIHERQVVRGVRVFDVEGNLLRDEELEADWDEIDSCWGFIGDDHAESEARSWLGLPQGVAA